jgi:tetraacyldisaccharide 4'-kinase
VHAIREPYHVRLVRGELRGTLPSLLRLLLAPPSWLFAAAAETRHALYRVGVFTRHRVPCPVVRVGNLTVGGTGKTPLVEWVVSEIRLLGLNPVVLSRGYGAAENEVPDELATLSQNLPDVHSVRDADRVRGALLAIEKHCAEVVVLDDGFQHHRLARQLDLVTVDATAPFGGGHCLPRGTLREPVRALRRAGGVVVTRSDQVSPERLESAARRIRRAAPRAELATAVHRPAFLRPLTGGEDLAPGWLEGRPVLAAAGIGNPAAFERTLDALGARVVSTARFPDHHAYRDEDLGDIARAAEQAGAEAVVTTQKDAVKWPAAADGCPPAYSLGIRLKVTSGADGLRNLLRSALRVGSAQG